LIADLHIGHTNIHEKWRTDFISQKEHDEYMVECWNSVVNPNDIVKVLGDFIIGIKNLAYIEQLKGQIHWILGNHDPKITAQILRQYPEISYVGGVMAYKGAVLSHAPIHPIELEYRNWSINIHGHQHEDKNMGDKYFNVNADVMGYVPKEFHSIMREAGKERNIK